MKISKIDINSDLGEGMGNDAAIMPFIGSCNIACGGHAGNLESIKATVALAAEHRVKVGAHPSFPDRVHFGRRVLSIMPKELEDTILEQISLLHDFLRSQDLAMHHVKAHGALYNEACKNAELANLLAELVKEHFPGCKLYAPYSSQMAIQAELAGVEVWYEVFADRRYASGLLLIPRSLPHAVIYEWSEIQARVLEMVERSQVSIEGGTKETILANTICVHGDHSEAVQTAKNLHQLLLAKGYLL